MLHCILYPSYFLSPWIGNEITISQSDFWCLISNMFTLSCGFCNVILGVSRHRSVVEKVGLTLSKKRDNYSIRNLGDTHLAIPMVSAAAVSIVQGNGLSWDFLFRVLEGTHPDNWPASWYHSRRRSIFRIRPRVFGPGCFCFGSILANLLILLKVAWRELLRYHYFLFFV